MAEQVLDNRGLESPEPMVRILRALGEMEDDDRLVAYMDREPLMLYSALERRGWDWSFSTEDGVQVLRVFHSADDEPPT